MRVFENKLAFILLLLTLPLLFLPKINFLSIGGETAGLRIDDLMLAGIGFFLVCSHLFYDRKLYKIESWILLLSGFSIFSFICNRLLVHLGILFIDAKIFYTLRLFEYFMFFYIGGIASSYFEGKTIVKAFLLWNMFLMILQKAGIAGGITATGYDDVSSRAQGIASFPSEMGLLLNLIFCYLIFDKQATNFIKNFSSYVLKAFLKKSYLFWIFAIFSIFVIFTGNRISILALIICFLFRLKQDYNLRSVGSLVSISLILIVLSVGIGILLANTAAIYDRSVSLFSTKNLELAAIIWGKIDLSQIEIGNEVVEVANYDVSWWLRIHKWVHVVKSYVTNPLVYLQGLGPGFSGAALDGGLLRILVENGLIGSFFYWKFFASIYKINSQLKWMSIAFLLNMIFFDAYLAYKTMSFLFLMAGHNFVAQKKQQKTNLIYENQAQKLTRPLNVSLSS